jgi:hypothetical protein
MRNKTFALELPDSILDYHKVATYFHLLDRTRRLAAITMILGELIEASKRICSNGRGVPDEEGVKETSTIFHHFSTIARK